MQWKPLPCVLIIFAMAEHAAITEGSSTAIGTIKFFPLIRKPMPRPRGNGIMPMQFSIMWSARDGVSPPWESTWVFNFGSNFTSYTFVKKIG